VTQPHDIGNLPCVKVYPRNANRGHFKWNDSMPMSAQTPEWVPAPFLEPADISEPGFYWQRESGGTDWRVVYVDAGRMTFVGKEESVELFGELKGPLTVEEIYGV